MQLYWPSYGLLITLQWGIVQGVKCERPHGSRCAMGGHGAGTGVAVRAVPFSRGTWSWAVQSSSTMHRSQMVLGIVTLPLSHRAALVWHCHRSGDRTGCHHPNLPCEEPAATWALSHCQVQGTRAWVHHLWALGLAGTVGHTQSHRVCL